MAKEHRLAVCAPSGVALRYRDLIVPFSGFPELRKIGQVGRKHTAKPRKKAWEVCLSIDRAEQFAKNGTLTEQTAKKIIGEIVERATGEPLHNMAANEWFGEWVASKAQVKSMTTAERYRQVA